ncbi:MAG TPA: hypothetical protein VHE30_26945 [Polyangiaceae bacterium]|nr:hypothetical protein [Polyangiaceae bacterium]
MSRSGAVAVFLVAGVFAACSSTNERKPYLGGGTDAFSGPGLVGGKGRSGSTSTPDGGSGPVGNGTLTGTVAVYQDSTFSTVQTFTGSGNITVRGTHDVTGTFVGGQFTVNGVDRVASFWVGLEATTQTTDLLPTISPADGTATSVALAFGRKSAILDILASAVRVPQELESDKAQIFLGFVSSSATPTPLAGVQITQSPGKDVLYDAGGIYTDADQATTQARGIAFIANATASAQFPGSNVVVTYQAPRIGKSGSVQILASAGAFTIALVPVN